MTAKKAKVIFIFLVTKIVLLIYHIIILIFPFHIWLRIIKVVILAAYTFHIFRRAVTNF